MVEDSQRAYYLRKGLLVSVQSENTSNTAESTLINFIAFTEIDICFKIFYENEVQVTMQKHILSNLVISNWVFILKTLSVLSTIIKKQVKIGTLKRPTLLVGKTFWNFLCIDGNLTATISAIYLAMHIAKHEKGSAQGVGFPIIETSLKVSSIFKIDCYEL
mmetsp:Transcript_25015/g.36359  ORF Transcript_25015/g.36359 Transcript_25015/m.36359 type:complete len:161 (-) Transcript_25015:172-654(-)